MSRRSLNRYQRRYPVLARVERRFHRSVSAVVANSEAIVTELQVDEGVPASRTVLIRNGIDTARFVSGGTRDETRKTLGIADAALVLVTVANLIPYKGHADLLRALQLADARLPDGWRWLCVGTDTGLGDVLRAQAVALGIDEHLLWLGRRGDVPQLLEASDIAVSPSHEEGSSNAVLESMAAALPVIATRVGGSPEAVLAGQTGLLVTAGDVDELATAIVSVGADPARAAAMGQAGRRRIAESFALDTCVRGYAELVDTLSGLPAPVAGAAGSDAAGLRQESPRS